MLLQGAGSFLSSAATCRLVRLSWELVQNVRKTAMWTAHKNNGENLFDWTTIQHSTLCISTVICEVICKQFLRIFCSHYGCIYCGFIIIWATLPWYDDGVLDWLWWMVPCFRMARLLLLMLGLLLTTMFTTAIKKSKYWGNKINCTAQPKPKLGRTFRKNTPTHHHHQFLADRCA